MRFQGQKNERVFFNLGMLAMDEGDVPAAEHWFRQAILIKDDFRAALFNLALLLADDHRPLQAAPFLNQLVRFHPDHVKALILLGDIYINNIKDLDAAENVSVPNQPNLIVPNYIVFMVIYTFLYLVKHVTKLRILRP